MGRRAEYHITYRKQRDDYRAAVPDGHGGREFIYGNTREEVLERLHAKLKERRDRPNPESPLKPDMPLARYVDHFLAANGDGLEPKTLRSYEQLLKGHVLPFKVDGHTLATMKLSQIKRRYLKALINAKRTAGYAKDTVRLIRAAISTVLTEAVDDELNIGKSRPPPHGEERGEGETQAEVRCLRRSGLWMVRLLRRSSLRRASARMRRHEGVTAGAAAPTLRYTVRFLSRLPRPVYDRAKRLPCYLSI